MEVGKGRRRSTQRSVERRPVGLHAFAVAPREQKVAVFGAEQIEAIDHLAHRIERRIRAAVQERKVERGTMPQRGEERKDNGVAPLFVRDAIVGEQESTELAVEAGWKRDQNGFARRSGVSLRCLLPGSDGGAKLAVATSSVIAIRRVMVWFTHENILCPNRG